MNTTIRVAIVDPYDSVREALKIVLEDCPNLLFVGEAQSAQKMLSLCGLVNPDVILFDFGLNDGDIGMIEQLRGLYPQVKVLVLTANLEPECVRNAIRSGASGYIYKMANIAELQQAIVSVKNRQRVVDQDIANLLSD